MHRKTFPVVRAILLLRPYLEGAYFTIRTDHNALKCILKFPYTPRQLAQWLIHLSQFEFVFYRPGVKHQASDVRLRLRTGGYDITPLGDASSVLSIVLWAPPRNYDRNKMIIPGLEDKYN